MIIGVLLIGILFGAVSAGCVLVAGYPIWVALLAYSLVGALASLIIDTAIYFLAMECISAMSMRRERDENPLPTITPFKRYRRGRKLPQTH